MRELLLVEASELAAKELSELLSPYYRVHTVSASGQVSDMLEMIRPQVVVLDLMLVGLDYVDVLTQIRNTDVDTVVIGTSLYLSEKETDILDSFRVVCVMEKPFLYEALVTRVLEFDVEASSAPLGKISLYLLKLNFRPNLNGFETLRTCLVYMLEHPGCAMTKELYPAVAGMLKTTTYQVERACRNCIAKAWSTRDRYVWGKIFPPNRVAQKRPVSNGEFLNQITTWIAQGGRL